MFYYVDGTVSVLQQGLAVIDGGHYGIEHIFVEDMKNYLLRRCRLCLPRFAEHHRQAENRRKSASADLAQCP